MVGIQYVIVLCYVQTHLPFPSFLVKCKKTVGKLNLSDQFKRNKKLDTCIA